jgi:hypothetical protein
MYNSNTFFGMDQAADLAIAKLGQNARCWAYGDRLEHVGGDINLACQIGTGGAGNSHVVLGTGPTWLDAARAAGLLK